MDCPNFGKEWTKDDLRLILSDAPTDYNALKWARQLGRSVEAVKMVYGVVIWARAGRLNGRTPRNQGFVPLVLEVARELGWVPGATVFAVEGRRQAAA